MAQFSANLGMLFDDSPFLDRFARAARAGFDAVEYMFPYEHDRDTLAMALRKHGLRQDLFNLPAGNWGAGDRGLATDPARRQEFRAGVESALAFADALECQKLNCLVGLRNPSLSWDTQYACLVENLGHAADRLGSAGLVLNVELLNAVDVPGFFLDSLAVTERLLDDVGDGLWFQCDLYHLQRARGELIPTIRRLAPRIGHVQIADAPDRHEPGTGEINYRRVLQELDAVDYVGRIGLEYRPSGRSEDSLGWIAEYGYALPASGHTPTP